MAYSGEEYKAHRKAKGLTQMQLASVAGLSSQAVVSNVERGLKPGKSVEQRLLKALDLK